MEKRLDSNIILNEWVMGTPITVRYDSNVLLNMLYNGSAVLNANIIGSPVLPGLTVTGLTSMGDVTINGSLFVNGPVISAQTQDLIVSANTITLNDGETGAGVTEGYAGIIIDRGSLDDYYFIFDENTQSFQIGEWATLQKVATREDNPINHSVAYWDNTENRFKTGVLYSDPLWTSVYMSGCTANGEKAFAVGDETIAGTSAAAFGYQTQAIGAFSLAEGTQTIADGQSSHAEGITSHSSGPYSHAEGQSTISSGTFAHAEGDQTQANADSAHSEGYKTIANAMYAHAEGNTTIAYGISAHAEGELTQANETNSHAEGFTTQASGVASHSEGYQTIASGLGSHSEGDQAQANGTASHAEGYQTVASGNYAHAEGTGSQATADNAHAEGNDTKAQAISSHAEGYKSIASGNQAHAEGSTTIASGMASHAGGYLNEASGNFSAVIGGQNNKATADNVVVLGGNGLTGSTQNTVYVQKFNIKDITGTATTPIGIDAQGNVVAYVDIDTNNYVTGATLNNYDLTLTRNDGTEIILNLFEIDSYLSGGTYNAGNINFVGHNVSFSVDVSALLDDTNTYVTGSTLDTYNLVLTRNDGVEITTDLSSLVTPVGTYTKVEDFEAHTGDTSIHFTLIDVAEQDKYISGGTYNAGTISFVGHNNNFDVDVSTLLDDTNTYVTGSTLDGSTLTLTRNDGVQISTDLAPISFTGDLATNLVLEHTTASNLHGIIYKDTVPFIHNFNYGNNGTVTTVGNNLFIGEGAGNLTMGATATSANHSSYNVGIGTNALYSNTTGHYNVANGYRALYSNTTGFCNVANGHQALYNNTTGYENIAIGRSAMNANTTGFNNTAVGAFAMMNNITGQDNTAYGAKAMMYATGGQENVAIGSSLLYCNGNHNTAIGNGSLRNSNAGSKNVGVGYIAGQKYGSGAGAGLSSVNNSIYIGYDSRAKEESITNEIVIGSGAIGNGTNTVTIGNTDITNTYLRGTTQSPTFSGETIEAVTQLIMTDVVDATRYSVVISAGTFVMTSL